MAEFLARTILPLIKGNYIRREPLPGISHYQVLCAMSYVLRVGCPWRDLPACYGNWTVSTRVSGATTNASRRV
jgi:transposase